MQPASARRGLSEANAAIVPTAEKTCNGLSRRAHEGPQVRCHKDSVHAEPSATMAAAYPVPAARERNDHLTASESSIPMIGTFVIWVGASDTAKLARLM